MTRNRRDADSSIGKEDANDDAVRVVIDRRTVENLYYSLALALGGMAGGSSLSNGKNGKGNGKGKGKGK